MDLQQYLADAERVDVGRGVEGGGAFSFDGFCFGQILIEVHIGELTDVV